MDSDFQMLKWLRIVSGSNIDVGEFLIFFYPKNSNFQNDILSLDLDVGWDQKLLFKTIQKMKLNCLSVDNFHFLYGFEQSFLIPTNA